MNMRGRKARSDWLLLDWKRCFRRVKVCGVLFTYKIRNGYGS